ncbi:alanine racemase [Terriglobus roseus]|uniref:Alanine racemase n=1 Tax=Terriglobus roseus TaxID=392734 RepID=A0A1G7PCN0_9BACT|nr:alanine racemase [Terriglobus roseus]SDF84056.1 alanine racemase [Terriglobus roseus]
MRSVLPSHTRPIWAEISASRLVANYRALQAAAGPQVEMLAVIKANAYGHGATECAPILAAAGAKWLGVTSVEEGVAVRQSLGILPQGMPQPRLLVMCSVWFGEEASVLDYGLTPVVWETYHLDLLEAEAKRRRLPARSLAVHVEIDTGMSRQGVAPGALLQQLLARFTEESPLLLEGVMTHLASTEIADDPQDRRQMRDFKLALEQVAAAELQPAYVHAGNTSSTDSGYMPTAIPALAAELGAKAMTRAGLALYGYTLPLELCMSGGFPEPHVGCSLRPVMTWKTRVVSLRDIAEGTSIGYNSTFVATKPMRVALLPVGYADGFRRGLSSSTEEAGGYVLLHGMRAAILGRVSMDLTVVDVTHLPQTKIGDEVVLVGSMGTEFVGANEQARIAGTSVYEVLCGISDRVPRVVVE